MPIRPGQGFIYNFTILGQRGTLFWHAHVAWLRATMHGAIVILPKRGIPYPCPKPHEEKVIILGEWRKAEWRKADVEAVLNQSTITGLPPNTSDARTINGLPGPVPVALLRVHIYREGGYTLHVESCKTDLLRIVNDELFFKIAGPNLTIVEADGSYVKPFETDTIFISPGKTTTALLTASQGIGMYLIAVTPFMDAPIVFDNLTAIGTLGYKCTPPYPKTVLTGIPPLNATPISTKFIDFLRSLNSITRISSSDHRPHRLSFTISRVNRTKLSALCSQPKPFFKHITTTKKGFTRMIFLQTHPWFSTIPLLSRLTCRPTMARKYTD